MALNPNTVLLLHCDDNITDSSTVEMTTAVIGTPTYDSIFTNFDKALVLNGSEGISITNSANLDFGSGSWQIDFKFRMTTRGTSIVLFSLGSTSTWYNQTIHFNISSSNSYHAWVGFGDGLSGWQDSMEGSTVLEVDTDYFFTLSCDGTTIRLFINGTIEDTTAALTLITPSTATTFGLQYSGHSFGLVGNIDEIRIVKNEAINIVNFNTPSYPYGTESTADFSLYTCNNQFYFDTDLIAGEDFDFDLTTPMSGVMSLYSIGANVVTGDVGVYSRGFSQDSGTMPLSMPLGTYISSGVLPLYTDNRIPDSGNIPTYLRGVDSSSGNIPLHEYGMIPVSGQGVDMYLFGAYLMSGVTVNTYVKGHITFPIYSLGGQGDRPAGNLYEDMHLYIGNSQPSGGSTIITGETMPIYTSALMTDHSGVFPIYAMADNGFSSGIFPIAVNSTPKKPYITSMGTYLSATATDGVMGGIYDSMPVFSMGYYGTTSVVRDTSWVTNSGTFPIYTESAERAMLNMYTQCGPFGASGDISTYLISSYYGSGDIPLYITSEDFAESGNIPLYIGSDQKAVLPLYILSKVLESGDINVYQHGITANKNANLVTYMHGDQSINDNMWVYFHGF